MNQCNTVYHSESPKNSGEKSRQNFVMQLVMPTDNWHKILLTELKHPNELSGVSHAGGGLLVWKVIYKRQG